MCLTDLNVGADCDAVSVLTDRIRVGEMDLGELPRRWKMLEDLYRVTRQALDERAPRLLHDRMIDETLTSGRRTYYGAQRCLDVAWDNHDALRSLLTHHGATQFAPWNLLRPTFEAAFHTIWLLDPDDSLERRRRGLLLEWLDELEHRAFYADLKSIERFVDSGDHESLEADLAHHRAVIEDHDHTYGREAEELGLTWPLPRKINVFDELGKLEHCRLMEGSDLILRSTWRTLSGMQHGRGSTLLRGSDRLDERPIEGGVEALLSINDEAFVGAATITNGLHQQAVIVFRDRSVPARA